MKNSPNKVANITEPKGSLKRALDAMEDGGSNPEETPTKKKFWQLPEDIETDDLRSVDRTSIVRYKAQTSTYNWITFGRFLQLH